MQRQDRQKDNRRDADPLTANNNRHDENDFGLVWVWCGVGEWQTVDACVCVSVCECGGVPVFGCVRELFVVFHPPILSLLRLPLPLLAQELCYPPRTHDHVVVTHLFGHDDFATIPSIHVLSGILHVLHGRCLVDQE